MPNLTRDAILAERPVATKIIDGHPWGDVKVRGLTALERDRYEWAIYQARENGKTLSIRAELVARGVLNGDGGRLFRDVDAKVLEQLPATEIEPLFEAIRSLSGMSDGDVAELEKN